MAGRLHVGTADDHCDVRAFQERRPIGDNLRAHLAVRVVGDPRRHPGTRLNGYRCTRGHELRH